MSTDSLERPGAVPFLTLPQNSLHSSGDITSIRLLYNLVSTFLLSNITIGRNFIGIFASSINTSNSSSVFIAAIRCRKRSPSCVSSPIDNPVYHDFLPCPIHTSNFSTSAFATSFGTVMTLLFAPFPTASAAYGPARFILPHTVSINLRVFTTRLPFFVYPSTTSAFAAFLSRISSRDIFCPSASNALIA